MKEITGFSTWLDSLPTWKFAIVMFGVVVGASAFMQGALFLSRITL